MRADDDEELQEKKTNPAQVANILSKLVFWYSLPLFREGTKRDLDESDLTKPLNEHKSSYLGEKIATIWSKEYERALKRKRKPRMGMVIVKTFWAEALLYGLVLFIMEMIARLSLPIFIGLFIQYFSEENRSNEIPPSYPMYFNRFFTFWTPGQSKIQKNEAYMYGAFITICSMLVVMVMHPYLLAALHLGMKMRVACCSLIYRKALRIKLSCLGGKTIGTAVNLMSNDVVRFDMAAVYVHYLWIGPVQTICILYFLYKEVGDASLVGMLAIAAAFPIQVIIGIRIGQLRTKEGARTDDRLMQMNEIIQSMQVIKMYSWENAFAELISVLRKKELRVLVQSSYIRGIIMSFIMFTTRLAIFLTVMYYIKVEGYMTAENVFVITSYYQILRATMTTYFPQGIAQVSEALVAIKRIEEFMMIEETDVGDPSPLNPKFEKPKRREERKFSDASSLAIDFSEFIKISRGIARYENEICLDNINLEFLPSSMTAIVGPVGSGKSCLFNVILGELPLFSGKLTVKGVISYAAQQSWLFAGSVRQNILFGREFEVLRYKQVVKACSLTRDFSLMPYADRTIVGEKGISLSGGQRARINLARCVYKRADIYLLDDPLSAVDIHVGQQLFDNCVKGILNDKIVILITHQLQYLKRADNIIVMDSGVVQAIGHYNDLIKLETDFTTILEEQNVARATGEEPEIEKAIKRISITSTAFNSMIDIEGVKSLPSLSPEMRTLGTVDFINYSEYFLAGTNCCGILCMILLFLGAQFFASGGDYFLSKWITLEEIRHHFGDAKEMGFYNKLSRETCIWIYTVFIVSTVVIALTRSVVFFTICVRSSMRLHERMFKSVIHAAMRFFNMNTSGRILNRFSKDLGAVDEMLPYAFIDTVQLLLNLVGAIAVVSTIEPYLLIPTAVMGICFYFLRRIYLATSRNIKRLEGITRSPVFAHLNASIQGLTTIRSNGAEEILVEEFDKLQDVHSSSWYMFLYTSRAFGWWLDMICSIYIGCVTFAFLLLEQGYDGSQVGLGITQCLGLSGLIQWGMRQSAELENQMTSVERVLEFTRIEHEPDLESTAANKPPAQWPRKGLIEFINVSLRYGPYELPVLRNISITIQPKEKIGIVGRTGAGKSSLISSLFRLAYFDGLILIDNLDIAVLGLHDLRRKISIIPQEPVIFSGTLRYNMDPFGEYEDEVILQALMDVELTNAMKRGMNCLQDEMTEGGTNLSVGQRQMVCLARAILRNNIILVMDEATANVDAQTDRFIQKTIRTKFAHCTVLTIAHRLHTVMDSDKVLVLEAGEVVEFDVPHILLQDSAGIFNDMVRKTGPGTSQVLRQIAKQTYEKKMNAEDENQAAVSRGEPETEPETEQGHEPGPSDIV